MKRKLAAIITCASFVINTSLVLAGEYRGAELAICQFFAKRKEKVTEHSLPFFIPTKESFWQARNELNKEQWSVMWPIARDFFKNKKVEDYSEVGLICTDARHFYLVKITLNEGDKI